MQARLNATFITLMQTAIEPFLSTSILGRAQKTGILNVKIISLLEELGNNHHKLDDTPYGGGPGELLRVDILAPIIAKALGFNPSIAREKKRVVLLDPAGTRFDQAAARRLCDYSELIFVSGRYEGIDARIHHYVDEAISIGDFVLSSGDLAAMAVFDATARMVPGVLGNEASTVVESHAAGRLEASMYTRPLMYEGHEVPEVLRGGHHLEIAKYRAREALIKTAQLRPDLLTSCPASADEQKLLKDNTEQNYPWQVLYGPR